MKPARYALAWTMRQAGYWLIHWSHKVDGSQGF